MSSTRKYGWVKDRYDERDLLFRLPIGALKVLPGIWDLRDKMPSIYNQSELGSCTANAVGGDLQYLEMKQGHPEGAHPFSRLFMYYNGRECINTVSEDSGAMIRDVVKCVNRFGACLESDWPYDISRFTEKPPQACYGLALLHQALIYRKVHQEEHTIKACLAAGFPVIFGIQVFESFESDEVAQTGVVPMPEVGETCVGGHAVLIVGYNDERQWFIVRNSWGENWGDKGYFYLPYKFVLNPELASDLWTIKLVE